MSEYEMVNDAFGETVLRGDKVLYARPDNWNYWTRGIVEVITDDGKVRLRVLSSTMIYPVRLLPGELTQAIDPRNIVKVRKF